MNKVILLTAFLFSCTSFNQQTFNKFEKLHQQHLVSHCSIYNINGDFIKRYPGHLCLFLNDGFLLITNNQNNELSLFDPDMRLVWKKKLHIHHQINITKNGNFLILSSESKKYLNRKTRFDLLLEFNRRGDEVSRFSFYEHRKKLLKNLLPEKVVDFGYSWDSNNQHLGVTEFSHANSFYEITSNKKEHAYPELRSGNFIVNSTVYNQILIIDSSLKKVLKYIKPPSSYIHDVQITAEGDILLYNNSVKNKNPETSELQIYNYPQQNLIWNYSRPGKDFFYLFNGGVHIFKQNEMLFSDIHQNSSLAIILDIKNKKELKVIAPAGQRKKSMQQIKMLNLDSFLRLNKGI